MRERGDTENHGSVDNPYKPSVFKMEMEAETSKAQKSFMENFGPSGTLFPSQALLSTLPLPETPFTPTGPLLLTA